MMHLADAPAMFQTVLSIFVCLAIHHVRDEPPCCQKRDCLCGLTTNLCLRVIAKCKTLLVMVAYRTDKPLSSVKLCLDDLLCEVFVKMEREQKAPMEARSSFKVSRTISLVVSSSCSKRTASRPCSRCT